MHLLRVACSLRPHIPSGAVGRANAGNSSPM